MAAGFFTTFVEDTQSNIKAYNQPSPASKWNQLCDAWDTFSANGGQ
jgi:hypothetical protein